MFGVQINILTLLYSDDDYLMIIDNKLIKTIIIYLALVKNYFIYDYIYDIVKIKSCHKNFKSINSLFFLPLNKYLKLLFNVNHRFHRDQLPIMRI